MKKDLTIGLNEEDIEDSDNLDDEEEEEGDNNQKIDIPLNMKINTARQLNLASNLTSNQFRKRDEWTVWVNDSLFLKYGKKTIKNTCKSHLYCSIHKK